MSINGKEFDKWLPADDIRLRRTLEFIGNTCGKRILDIGMKYGFTLEKIEGELKIGIDIEYEYLKKARIKNKVLCSVFALPFKKGSFDISILTEVFEHIPEPEKAIAEISGITSGHLVLSTPNNCFARKLKHFLLGKPSKVSPDHFREYSWKEVKNIAEKSGFKMARFTGIGFFLTYRFYPIMELLGKLFPRLSSDMLMEFRKRKLF